MNDSPKWFQVFGLIFYDVAIVVASVFLIMNSHPVFAVFLLLFISDGSDFGVNITWNNNDKEDDK